jgi:uncharacterized protein YunC (DUF1805 family)
MDKNSIFATWPEQFAVHTTKAISSDTDDIASIHPLSNGQHALWVLQGVAPESTLYNVSAVGRLRSRVNIAALSVALQKLVNRHASLRSTFRLIDGEPVQIEYAYLKCGIEQIDASNWNDDKLNDAVDAMHVRSFDLLNGPVVRATLFT